MRTIQYVFGLLAFALGAHAVPLTGTYTTGGTTTGTGPWTMSTTAAVTDFAVLRFIVNESVTFADLTSLSVDFESTAGGGGLGSPRLVIVFSDNTTIHLHLGTSPGFIDTDATLNTHSDQNYIGNNDAGRYDTSAQAGGSPFTTYNSALALVGGKTVNRFSLVMDNYAGRTLVVQSIDAEIAATSVPEGGASVLLLGMGLAALGLMRRKLS